MAKAFDPQVITANDLVEGDSVFLGPAGWTRDVGLARVAETPEALAALEAEGRAAEDANLVVGPYAVAVSLEGGRPWPRLRREQIRASGNPTVAVGPQAAAEVARAA